MSTPINCSENEGWDAWYVAFKHPCLAASTTQLGNFFLMEISVFFLIPPALVLRLISIFHFLASAGDSPFPVIDILAAIFPALKKPRSWDLSVFSFFPVILIRTDLTGFV